MRIAEVRCLWDGSFHTQVVRVVLSATTAHSRTENAVRRTIPFGQYCYAVIQQLLDGIELRERRLTERTRDLAARLHVAEREALATTAKTINAMAADLDLEQPPAPALPAGAACQQIMSIFDHERLPLRARDLCRALDLPVDWVDDLIGWRNANVGSRKLLPSFGQLNQYPDQGETGSRMGRELG